MELQLPRGLGGRRSHKRGRINEKAWERAGVIGRSWSASAEGKEPPQRERERRPVVDCKSDRSAPSGEPFTAAAFLLSADPTLRPVHLLLGDSEHTACTAV